MRFVAIIFVGFVLTGLGVPARASDKVSSPREIAQCVVDNDSSDVRRLLATVPGSRGEASVAPKVLEFYAGCADNTPITGSMLWRDRAELADAALAVQLGKKTPDLAASVGNGWQLMIAPGMTAGTDYDTSAVGMRMVGDCVVRAAPQAALDVARAVPGSAAELRAVSALSPALAPCMSAGKNFRVKRADVRLIVAEPLYHLLGK